MQLTEEDVSLLWSMAQLLLRAPAPPSPPDTTTIAGLASQVHQLGEQLSATINASRYIANEHADINNYSTQSTENINDDLVNVLLDNISNVNSASRLLLSDLATNEKFALSLLYNSSIEKSHTLYLLKDTFNSLQNAYNATNNSNAKVTPPPDDQRIYWAELQAAHEANSVKVSSVLSEVLHMQAELLTEFSGHAELMAAEGRLRRLNYVNRLLTRENAMLQATRAGDSGYPSVAIKINYNRMLRLLYCGLGTMHNEP